jgi:Na+-transporting NADH:ubiquinone oxidoreductase subunit NqrC
MKVFMLSAQDARKLRPSLVSAMVLAVGLIAVLALQLVLNMIVTQDAYHLRSLQAQQRDLATDVQIIQEQVASLGSPQNLADAANQLGMVANPSSVLLDIETNRVFGEPKPADEDSAGLASANLVANSALGSTSRFIAASLSDAELIAGVSTELDADAGVTLQSGLIPASPTR